MKEQILHWLKMYKALLLICSLLMSHMCAGEENLSEQWQQFQNDFQKTYKNPVEKSMRFKIFKDNLMKINRHNQEYENGKHTYTMGVNKFADLLPTEFREVMLMDLSDIEVESDPVPETIIITDLFTNSTAPDELDWRTEGAVTAVKDQGQCGSCWAFSATGSMESRTFLETNVLPVLSEQNLVDCSTANYGCDGGWHYLAMDYVVANGGIDTEAAYPYEAVDGSCRYSADAIGAQISGRVQTPYNDEEGLKNAVATEGPISVAIDAEDAFQLYSGGVLIDSSCSDSYQNHAVLVVGYGTQDGQDYWLVKNSWGTSWGEDGYIKMARNYNNMCAIASSAYYPYL